MLPYTVMYTTCTPACMHGRKNGLNDGCTFVMSARIERNICTFGMDCIVWYRMVWCSVVLNRTAFQFCRALYVRMYMCACTRVCDCFTRLKHTIIDTVGVDARMCSPYPL